MKNQTKLINPVFGDIINGKTYDTFLKHPIKPLRPEFTNCSNLYEEWLVKTKTSLDLLSKLEEAMIQMRCEETVFKEIKLSEVRGYIYARAPFYVQGSKKKDLRVTVGKTSVCGDDLNVLLKDDDFVNEAKKKLIEQMTIEIESTLMDVEKMLEETKVII